MGRSSGPTNLVHKLLEGHLSGGEIGAGRDIRLDPDQILIQDSTGTMTALQFEALGADSVDVPLVVVYVDHNVIQIDHRNMDDHIYLQSFCDRYGLLYSRPGNGISHYVHLERFANPGGFLLGADSHTPQCGALGMLGIGTGGLETAAAMAGYGFSLECPEVVQVELQGVLPGWVQAKDVILELLRRHGVRGGLSKIFEFTGTGVETLSVMERATICNMIVETGAIAAVFPSDDRVMEWLKIQRREEDFVPLAADRNAPYDHGEVIYLGELEPLIAKPHSPGNVVPVREVAGTEIAQVCVGSSVNSSYEDLAITASVLLKGMVHPALQMTVTPGSRQILDTIARSGVYRDLVAAGARILEPVCGPCVGQGQAPSAGRPSLRTFNRNFPGRSGTQNDVVYLCSPATAAASALRGEITDPRDLGAPPDVPAPIFDPEVEDRQILKPPAVTDGPRREVVRGPNIVPPPQPRPLPEAIRGKVTIVVEDDISTGDMAPDGVVGMGVWSNIPECAKYMFRRLDPDFPDRARAWGGGIIVGGHNYGQGSSREHAALSAVHLGIAVIVAKSFARIHRRNLICQGILPLVLEDEKDHSGFEVGDEWTIEDVRSSVASGATNVVAGSHRAGTIPLRIELSDEEREIALAGGLVSLLKRSPRR